MVVGTSWTPIGTELVPTFARQRPTIPDAEAHMTGGFLWTPIHTSRHA